jgi:sRNA-binding regulator protein Hfq
MSLLSVGTAFAQQSNQDVVYLKNGSVIRGVITEQVPNTSVKIRTTDGNQFVYAIADVSKMTKEAPLHPSVEPKTKSTWGAFGLSFLFPGLGQYYNGGKGNIIKGLIQSGTFVSGAVMAYSNDTTPYTFCFSTCSTYEVPYTSNKNYAGLGMMSGAWLWSVIDAPISASGINSRARAQRQAHMIELKHGDNLVGFDISPKRGGAVAQMTYSFSK